MNTFNRARVLLVGSGRMGQIRAGLLYANPRFEIGGVVDTDMTAASKLASKYESLPFTSVTEALDYYKSPSRSPMDGVIISTPTHTHNKLIHESAQQGLSIFTEKPVDETAVKIEAQYDLCRRSGNTLCCSFQRRFDHSYVAVQEAFRRGSIGNALTARIFFGDHPCPSPEFLLTGGNIFMDLSAHDVDYIRWCLNDEIESVYATGTSSTPMLADAGVHDNATMLLNFSRGAVVTIFMSRSACYGYDQRCEIFGDKGLLKVENEHDNTSIHSTQSGVHHTNLKHSFPQRFNQAYAAELDAFADTLLNGTPWPISAQDCVAVQKVSDAAQLSCETNKVVQLHSLTVDEEEIILDVC